MPQMIAADGDLAVDVVPRGADEARELEHAGGEDDRRREQEREARGVLVGEPAPQAADHRDARAADARGAARGPAASR